MLVGLKRKRKKDEEIKAYRMGTDFCWTTLVGTSDLKDWHRIAKKLPGRSNKDCRKRWCNNVTEGLRKGQWEEDEDSRLERGIQKHGYQFVCPSRSSGEYLIVS